MFLQRLNDTEKQRFLALAISMMEADGVFAGYEAQYLEFLEAEIGNLPATNMDFGAGIKEEAARMFGASSQIVKRTVCLEILIVAHIDGKLGVAEIEFMKDLAAGLGLSSQEFDRLKAPAAELARAYFKAGAALK